MHQNLFGNQNDDYLEQFKQKVAEQKNATLEARRTELARSRNNFLGTIAGIVLAGAVGWFVLAPQYQQANKETPIIHRPQIAVKIKPDNPGGMEIPNQDKEVYKIVEKKNIDNTVVENLLPSPETPKLPDIVPDEIVIDKDAVDLDEIVEDVSKQSDDETANMADDKITEKAQEAKNSIKEESAVVEKETTKVEETAKNQIEAKKEEVNKTLDNGKWQIQLIASKNKDAIEKTWQTLAAKYTLLQAYKHEVQSANLGAQGTLYKLRVGSFATKEEAQKICNTLRTKGLNDCIAKER